MYGGERERGREKGGFVCVKCVFGEEIEPEKDVGLVVGEGEEVRFDPLREKGGVNIRGCRVPVCVREGVCACVSE